MNICDCPNCRQLLAKSLRNGLLASIPEHRLEDWSTIPETLREDWLRVEKKAREIYEGPKIAKIAKMENENEGLRKRVAELEGELRQKEIGREKLTKKLVRLEGERYELLTYLNENHRLYVDENDPVRSALRVLRLAKAESQEKRKLRVGDVVEVNPSCSKKNPLWFKTRVVEIKEGTFRTNSGNLFKNDHDDCWWTIETEPLVGEGISWRWPVEKKESSDRSIGEIMADVRDVLAKVKADREEREAAKETAPSTAARIAELEVENERFRGRWVEMTNFVELVNGGK